MQNLITQEKFQRYTGLSKNFDLPLVFSHLDAAFRRNIFPFVSEKTLHDYVSCGHPLKEKFTDLVLRAGSCYTVVIAIPFLKVKLSNFGIDQFTQDKMKPASWWDVRDLGLSYLKMADEALSDAISLASKEEYASRRILFFENFSFSPLPTPEEFDKIYSINKSFDVYRLLIPIMERVWNFSILPKIGGCVLSDLKERPCLTRLVKEALAFHSLAHATELSQFVFTKSGVAFQYDELPWKKSLLLDISEKENLRLRFLEIARGAMKEINMSLSKDPQKFPCYKALEIATDREPIAKKSGLYL